MTRMSLTMAFSSHICAVNRAVEVGGRLCIPSTSMQADRHAPVVRGQGRRVSNFSSTTSDRHRASRTGPASQRRRVASPLPAGVPIECAATPTVFLSVDRCSTGPAVFPHRKPHRRPTLSDLPRGGDFGRQISKLSVLTTVRAGRFFFSWSSVDRALLNSLAARLQLPSQARRDVSQSLKSTCRLHDQTLEKACGKVWARSHPKLGVLK